ncbi:hypothetical protein LCGC14_0927120 [marine sediment metagenome]|uniref:Uncharacterized protein n=1 Tax=marine sediment metagenome TaxID=412755 RepID=A0A0F9R7S9_9ZZZZ
MKQIGSQIREELSESGYKLVDTMHGQLDAILENENGQELWSKSDDFAGYVIEIFGIGYEFVMSRDSS